MSTSGVFSVSMECDRIKKLKMWPRGWVEVELYSSVTAALEGVSGQQHALAALYPRERPGTHFTGGWVGPKAGLDGQKILSSPDFFKLCLLVLNTLWSQQFDSCSLLVSLCHTLHSVTASRGESLRGWEVFAVQRCTVPYYHLLVRL
jgi:hypothetical protein